MKHISHLINPQQLVPGIGVLLLTALLLLIAQAVRPAPLGAVVELELSAVQAQTARTFTFSYDSAGRITAAGYGGASLRYQYDASGNLITQTYQSSIYLPVITRQSN